MKKYEIIISWSCICYSVGGRCTVGHFCPNGSSVESDCTPGYYCDVDELSEPTGPCSVGHYCNSGSSTPVPTDGTEGGQCDVSSH